MLLLSLLLALHAQAEPFFLADAIYAGRPVAADGQTWKSVVGLSFETSDGGYAACTGVLVGEDLIVTAAHCRIKNGGFLEISLYKENSLDATTLTPKPEEFRYEANPRYRKVSAYDPGHDDVAVLVLKNQTLPDGFEPAQFQTAAQVHASDPGRTVTVVGAGVTEKGGIAEHLYFAQGRITGYQANDVMQVQFPGRTGVCGGDSGGAVFVTSGKQLYLSALNTAIAANINKECGNVLYTNVIDAARYAWIQAAAARIRGEL